LRNGFPFGYFWGLLCHSLLAVEKICFSVSKIAYEFWVYVVWLFIYVNLRRKILNLYNYYLHEA
jgi:hypothetical protein